MQTSNNTHRELTLILDEKEIKFLQDLTQNHLGGGREHPVTARIRKELFEATKPPVENRNG
jgi:hypothetical protein